LDQVLGAALAVRSRISAVDDAAVIVRQRRPQPGAAEV
jgi:hypothetical protein